MTIEIQYPTFTFQQKVQNGLFGDKMMIRIPDIIYLISEGYISYTRLYLLIQDGRHNSKWPPAEPKIKISELLDIILGLS